jgi:hypothetical protein
MCHWLGVAFGRGIRLSLVRSKLLQSVPGQAQRYGYEADDTVKIMESMGDSLGQSWFSEFLKRNSSQVRWKEYVKASED